MMKLLGDAMKPMTALLEKQKNLFQGLCYPKRDGSGWFIQSGVFRCILLLNSLY